MKFRIGVNLGDVVEQKERIYGDGVNIAARIEGMAEAGGVCLSGTVYDSIENKLELEYEYLGEQKVKNIQKPIRLYQVQMRSKAPEVIDFGEKKALTVPDQPSIAVLPFKNLSGDPGQEFFSDGFTEDIITTLAQIPLLFVIARESSFTFKGKSLKILEIGRDLGVRYVLEGSIQKFGNQIRITAQLIDTRNGHHLWAEKYDRELKDIFVMRDEITMILNTAGKPEEAISVLKNAMRLNPIPPGWYFGRLGDAYRLTGQYEKAVHEYKKAIQLQPDEMFSHLNFTLYYVKLERETEAHAEAAEGLRINPEFSAKSYVNPNVAKAGGIQIQGAKGAAVAIYCNPLATPELDSSGFPARVKT